MNASIPSKDLLKAAQQFTLPISNIVQPKVVICLGIDIFNTGQLGRKNRNRGGINMLNRNWSGLVEYV
jgi:hypothetical protein